MTPLTPFRSEPPIGDGRPAIATLLEPFEALVAAGWRMAPIAAQGGAFPIRAYLSREPVDWLVLAGIHGREPAGAVACSRYAGTLRHLGLGRGILVLPLLNPWGYWHHERYGPSGPSWPSR